MKKFKPTVFPKSKQKPTFKKSKQQQSKKSTHKIKNQLTKSKQNQNRMQ